MKNVWRIVICSWLSLFLLHIDLGAVQSLFFKYKSPDYLENDQKVEIEVSRGHFGPIVVKKTLQGPNAEFLIELKKPFDFPYVVSLLRKNPGIPLAWRISEDYIVIQYANAGIVTFIVDGESLNPLRMVLIPSEGFFQPEILATGITRNSKN
jgi:hypothetical protein